MRIIRDTYQIRYGDVPVGTYYVYEDGGSEFDAFRDRPEQEPVREALDALGLTKNRTGKTQLPRFRAVLNKGERMPGTRKVIWMDGPLRMERVPRDAERFLVYRRSAGKGSAEYSPKAHSAPHKEGVPVRRLENCER